MMYRLLSFAVLLLALHCALAMPDHPASMRMSGELSHEVDTHNETATNNTNIITITTMSIEDEDDDDGNDEDDDDDDIHVEGKSSSCPAPPPEMAEIEQQCLTEYRQMKKGDTCMEQQTKDIIMIKKDAPNAATIRLERVPDSRSSEETTETPGPHNHRAHSSYYYHCLLKKLDWLNEVEALSKSKIEAWIATNITDETQREQTLKQLNHCLLRMKDETDVTESSTESTEEIEQSTETSSKQQEQMKCNTSKKLVCCLRRIECPIIKFP